MLALTRSLAVHFAPLGVRTNAISPGPIETPLLMDWLVKDEEAKRIRLARNPTGRFGKPEEIVNLAVYLASDESRWTNGANLVVDGVSPSTTSSDLRRAAVPTGGSSMTDQMPDNGDAPPKPDAIAIGVDVVEAASRVLPSTRRPVSS